MSFHFFPQIVHSAHTFLFLLSTLLLDLATVVNSQWEEIQDLETIAIESLDHASSGVSHIMSLQAKFQHSNKENKHLYAAAITIFLFVFAHWIYWSRFEADNDNNDMPEHP